VIQLDRSQQTNQTPAFSQPDNPYHFLADLKAALAEHQESHGTEYRVTPAGLWTRSDLDEVLDLFVQIGLGQYKCMVDLGSGEGRVVCLASYFTQAVGIEADPWLVAQSRVLAADLGLDRAEFKQTDLSNADLSPYDLLYVFPDKPLDWLERMPLRSWRGKLLVYGSGFQPESLRHLSTIYAGNTVCSLWCR
jgi:hypothetical protein